jgi:hypothetical protein
VQGVEMTAIHKIQQALRLSVSSFWANSPRQECKEVK